jgi:hypothetical protein
MNPWPAAPDPGERTLGRGSAKPITCDATAGSDLDAAAGSRTIESPRKTASSSTRAARRMGPSDLGVLRDGVGARRPAAPPGAALFFSRQIRHNAALNLCPPGASLTRVLTGCVP